MDDKQRSAMFNAWRMVQDKREKDCGLHRWGYAEPVRCLDCGKVKDKL